MASRNPRAALIAASVLATVLSSTGPISFIPPALAQTAPAADDPVVARVNGRELRKSDVAAMQRTLPPQVQQMPLERIYPLLLNQMVNGILFSEAGRKANLNDGPDFKRRLAMFEDRLLEEAYLNKAIEAAATDAKVKEKYDEYVKSNPGKEEVSARHILVEKEDQAKAIIAELAKGADFATLAKAKSTDPAGKEGGDLGFFSKDQMVPEFAEAAFNLAKGEITKTPVKTQFGWHVIKVEDKRCGAPVPLEAVREELTNGIAREVIDAQVKSLRADAKVELLGLDGKPLPQ